MPPKKGDQPKPAKVAVDKSFGLKNKKGGAAQKEIKRLQTQSADAKSPEEKRKAAEKDQRQKEKAAAEQAKKETADLFKPVQTQKVPFGVDPKTVLCEFFKKGNCEKGRKCKFSHDLNVGRKAEKRGLYADGEGGEADDEKAKEEATRQKDDMADWDEAKLQNVILSKHGNPKTTTDKVCKYFVSAVENGKYGWFWSCPNDEGGKKCMYRHTLPPGFVLKTREQRAAEKAERDGRQELTLEDFLESERHKLTGDLTPVTPETFAKWKKERIDKKQAEDQARKAKDESGRAMFERGELQGSDDEEDDDDEDDDKDTWNMEALRRETEAAREKKEEERLLAQFEDVGGGTNGVNGVS
ncbi:MAG: hypothetical protein M1828_007413 [Chrysothrix sp. TS-e1954]|nr:MAG: hypothetical protein M1828_007413 [Chrysothrix sp. TS-e1954]